MLLFVTLLGATVMGGAVRTRNLSGNNNYRNDFPAFHHRRRLHFLPFRRRIEPCTDESLSRP